MLQRLRLALSRQARRSLVSFVLVVTAGWAVVVITVWVLIVVVWSPPSLHNIDTRISTLQIALWLIGGVAALVALLSALQPLQAQLRVPELELYVEWEGPVASENQQLRDGAKLDGAAAIGTDVRLFLLNCGYRAATGLTVNLRGNANINVTRSQFFKGEDGSLPLGKAVVWRSAPNVSIDQISGGGLREGTLATMLDLGRVRWDREEGIYYLQLYVTANGMPRPKKFVLSLETKVGPYRN